MKEIKIQRHTDTSQRNAYGKPIEKVYFTLAIQTFRFYWRHYYFLPTCCSMKYKAQMEDILTKREVSFTYEPSHKSATHFISEADAERVRQDIINNPNKYSKLDLWG